MPRVRPVPPAPVIKHRRPASARTWTPSRSELSRALAMGPGHLAGIYHPDLQR